MKVKLISTNIEEDKNILYLASKTCRSEEAPSITEQDKDDLVKKVILRGHDSILEHATFTYMVENISRVATHQLVRHRIGCSYSQQSLRHSKTTNYYMPEKIFTDDATNAQFSDIFGKIMVVYEALLQQGVTKEDARYILPMAVTSNIVITLNGRSLFHFLDLRLCNRAQEEIRELAFLLYKATPESVTRYYKTRCDSCKESCGKTIQL